jgi:hypothetical protein
MSVRYLAEAIPRMLTTAVELQLRTHDRATWERADEVMSSVGAVPGVASVTAKRRCDHYMDLDLEVKLKAASKAELRKLYNKVSRIAEQSPFRFAGRQCVLDDLF